METFLVYCIPCSLIGMFIGAMLCQGANTKIGKAVAFLISTAIVTAICAGALTLDTKEQTDIWNDGICSECGGSYDFVNASRYRGTTSYYWECDKCGNIIETTMNMR